MNTFLRALLSNSCVYNNAPQTVFVNVVPLCGLWFLYSLFMERNPGDMIDNANDQFI